MLLCAVQLLVSRITENRPSVGSAVVWVAYWLASRNGNSVLKCDDRFNDGVGLVEFQRGGADVPRSDGDLFGAGLPCGNDGRVADATAPPEPTPLNFRVPHPFNF
jgi:hypothetical protein